MPTRLVDVATPMASTAPLRVAVVGGSLGGLAAAVALGVEAGCEVDVFERSPRMQMTEGAGLWVQAEFENYMRDNGVTDIAEAGCTPDSMTILDIHGKKIYQGDGGGTAACWDVLHGSYLAALERLPAGSAEYHSGVEVDAAATVDGHLGSSSGGGDDEPVVLRFSDGMRREFDLVVFCDGSASRARPALGQYATPPFREADVRGWAGYWIWRSTIQEEDLPPDLAEYCKGEYIWYYLRQAEGEWRDGGRMPPHVHDPSLPGTGHFLMYPVPGQDGSITPGKRRLMWAWYVVPGIEDPLATFEAVMTDVNGVLNTAGVGRGKVRPEIVRRLHDIAVAVLPPPLARLVALASDPYPQALLDTAVPQMAFRRIALIGDAAFTARPTTGAGTTKAAINGIELGRALKGVQSGGVTEALRGWEPEQIDIGRVLVARGGNGVTGVSGKLSAFPDDYAIGRRVQEPPPAPYVAEAIREYLADPEVAELRTRRVYASTGVSSKPSASRPSQSDSADAVRSGREFWTQRVLAEQGRNDLGGDQRSPARL